MNHSLSSNTYLNDILHQPDALKDTLAAFEYSRFDKIRHFAEGLADNSLKRIVLTGMGSSFHALHPLFLSLVGHGLPAQMLETAELIHFAPRLFSPDTLVIAASQSGQSAEVLQLLERTGKETPLIGITNTPQSPLAQNAQAGLITHAGAEHSVSCKTYTSTLAALAILGDLLTGQEATETISAFQAAVISMSEYLAGWESHVEAALHTMEGIRYLILAGRGVSLAAAGTGGLIIKEAAHFPAEGMSCAAFRHGPLEMISPGVFILVYEGTGFTRKLNANLVTDIQKAAGRTGLVSMQAVAGLFNLPSAPEKCLPVMEILPAQMLSLALAVSFGHTPGQFTRATKVTAVE
jgi:glucosamine--fructose-6-phosphate aminotransferase (isomerizing)